VGELVSYGPGNGAIYRRSQCPRRDWNFGFGSGRHIDDFEAKKSAKFALDHPQIYTRTLLSTGFVGTKRAKFEIWRYFIFLPVDIWDHLN
jgi:hypothetical protein